MLAKAVDQIRTSAFWMLLGQWPLCLFIFGLYDIIIVYAALFTLLYVLFYYFYASALGGFPAAANNVFFTIVFFFYYGYYPWKFLLSTVVLLLVDCYLLWSMQYYIWRYRFRESVFVIGEEKISADSAHLAAKFGEAEAMFELFKERGVSSEGPIWVVDEEKQKVRYKTLRSYWTSPFWIPTINYGVIGATKKPFARIREIYDELKAKYGMRYNLSHQSCHEFALRLAKEAVKADSSDIGAVDLRVSAMTNTKHYLVLGAVYGVILFSIIYVYVLPFSTIAFRPISSSI